MFGFCLLIGDLILGPIFKKGHMLQVLELKLHVIPQWSEGIGEKQEHSVQIWELPGLWGGAR